MLRHNREVLEKPESCSRTGSAFQYCQYLSLDQTEAGGRIFSAGICTGRFLPPGAKTPFLTLAWHSELCSAYYICILQVCNLPLLPHPGKTIFWFKYSGGATRLPKIWQHPISHEHGQLKDPRLQHQQYHHQKPNITPNGQLQFTDSSVLSHLQL